MPKTSKRKREEGKKAKAEVVTLPELPDELWRKIVYDVGKHSVACASAMRLVDKWHSRVLARTQIWTAFTALFEWRTKARDEASDWERSAGYSLEVYKRHRSVRDAEERGDLMMIRIAMRQCQLDPHMSIDTLRRSLQATREVCNEYGSSMVSP